MWCNSVVVEGKSKWDACSLLLYHSCAVEVAQSCELDNPDNAKEATHQLPDIAPNNLLLFSESGLHVWMIYFTGETVQCLIMAGISE